MKTTLGNNWQHPVYIWWNCFVDPFVSENVPLSINVAMMRTFSFLVNDILVEMERDYRAPYVSLQTRNCKSFFLSLSDEYSCLMVVFDFQRQYGYYVTQIYIPSALIVFMSWISFWLSPECSAARISLGITTFLAMATQMGSAAGASLPRVRVTIVVRTYSKIEISRGKEYKKY